MAILLGYFLSVLTVSEALGMLRRDAIYEAVA